MKLKNLKKICSDVRYDICVFDENGRFIEDFKIDYAGMDNKELSAIICNKYFKYENCKVKNFSSDIHNNVSWTRISITI